MTRGRGLVDKARINVFDMDKLLLARCRRILVTVTCNYTLLRKIGEGRITDLPSEPPKGRSFVEMNIVRNAVLIAGSEECEVMCMSSQSSS